MKTTHAAPPVLYTKAGCPWCQQAREVLAEHAVAYDEVSVSDDDTAFAKMRTLSGQTLAPVLDWRGEILADFGPELLRPFLASRHPLTRA